MKTQTKYIIGAVALVAVVAVVYFLLKKKKETGSFNPLAKSTIPAEVLAEPVEDWEGEVLEFQGVKYTPVNGVWQTV